MWGNFTWFWNQPYLFTRNISKDCFERFKSQSWIIAGEMGKLRGQISINGDLAYVPQQPWIQNMSVRDNITFGKPFDRKRYNQVDDFSEEKLLAVFENAYFWMQISWYEKLEKFLKVEKNLSCFNLGFPGASRLCPKAWPENSAKRRPDGNRRKGQFLFIYIPDKVYIFGNLNFYDFRASIFPVARRRESLWHERSIKTWTSTFSTTLSQL